MSYVICNFVICNISIIIHPKWNIIINSPHFLASSIQYRDLLCLSKPFLNSHPTLSSHLFPWNSRCSGQEHPSSNLNGALRLRLWQNCTWEKTVHWCASRLETFHPFKLSTSSLSAFCCCWKVQSIESSFTVWSNLLDVNMRMMIQLNTTAPLN